MADRVFSSLLLIVAVGYTFIAFTVIKAPFQYDPLGPESWPRLVGIIAVVCTLYVVIRPDVSKLGVSRQTAIRLAALAVMLIAYAWLFQPLGFILSTWLFCAALCIMLGGRVLSAIAFGAIAGIAGYLICTGLLELNLPAGILSVIL